LRSDITRHRPGRHAESVGEPEDGVAYVLDDDPAALELMCDIAEEAGWQCRAFTRLRELKASLANRRPGVMVLDDDLPDGSGGDLARELREDPIMSRIPVVICSAAHPMRKAEITSWAPVVSKPFRIDELERFLRRAHEQAESPSRSRAAG
jgi:DNA-binding response OmpR family regulator